MYLGILAILILFAIILFSTSWEKVFKVLDCDSSGHRIKNWSVPIKEEISLPKNGRTTTHTVLVYQKNCPFFPHLFIMAS